MTDAIQTDRTIDITTTGRASSQPRRIEIWFHNVDDTVYITGRPGKRHWYANLQANPDFTFHLKETAQADIPATARPITTESERREVLSKILANLNFDSDLEQWVAESPLVEVTLHPDS